MTFLSSQIPSTVQNFLDQYILSLQAKISYYENKPDSPPDFLLQWYLVYSLLLQNTSFSSQGNQTALEEIRDRLPEDGQFPIQSADLVTRLTYCNFTDTADVVKNTSGRVFALTLHNKGNQTMWIQLFDKMSNPTQNEIPLETHPIFALNYLILDSAYFGPGGAMFSEGISYAFSVTEGIYVPPAEGFFNFRLHLKYI